MNADKPVGSVTYSEMPNAVYAGRIVGAGGQGANMNRHNHTIAGANVAAYKMGVHEQDARVAELEAEAKQLRADCAELELERDRYREDADFHRTLAELMKEARPSPCLDCARRHELQVFAIRERLQAVRRAEAAEYERDRLQERIDDLTRQVEQDRKDVDLGRLVRAMPLGYELVNDARHPGTFPWECHDNTGRRFAHTLPEDALRAAGITPPAQDTDDACTVVLPTPVACCSDPDEARRRWAVKNAAYEKQRAEQAAKVAAYPCRVGR